MVYLSQDEGYRNQMKGKKRLLLCAPSALISLRVKARRRN
jgi:hypothetical protein